MLFILRLVVLLIVVQVFVLNASATKYDWFSSVSVMEDLVSMDHNFLSTFGFYIEGRQNALNQLKTMKALLEKTASPINEPEKYIIHPLNQYSLVKRFALKWSKIEELLEVFRNENIRSQLNQMVAYIPDKSDLVGAAEAIVRLQKSYNLDINELVNGNVKGFTSGTFLKSEDCFRMGKAAFENRLFDLCEPWLNKSLELYVKTQKIKRDNITSLLDLCKQYVSLKHVESAESLQENNSKDSQENNTMSLDDYEKITDHSNLCLGNFTIVCPNDVKKQLKCYYFTNKQHPRLLLSPIKLEELWNFPHIVRFHDIVSDKEANAIIELAKPQVNTGSYSIQIFIFVYLILTSQNLERVEGSDISGDNVGTVKYRVSSTAWFYDDASYVVKKLSQRVSDATGLTGYSEALQVVANYGMGGHYIAHYDHAVANDSDGREEHPQDQGARIATALFYLSDVPEGGSTAFLQPRIAAEPIKGSAVFWFNLFPSGKGDSRTLHAACPVLIGNKWASNKWFREFGNEFVRRCDLDRNS
uniref:procollagen-proline 4-dioxygenase n=1 Tax=Ciona savignyi TaxID=51511 RepID=H2ZIE7_CIOSA